MKILEFLILVFLTVLDIYAYEIDGKIEFFHNYHGACYMLPLSDQSKLKRVLHDKSVIKLALIGGGSDKAFSHIELKDLYKQSRQGWINYRLGLYEIYSSTQTFLGIAGFLNKTKGVLKAVFYLLPQYQDRKICYDALSALTNYAFQVSDCNKISADIDVNKLSTKIFDNMGWIRIRSECAKGLCYEITRETKYQRGLSEFLKIVRKNPERFLPKTQHLATIDMARVRNLWSEHFSGGVPLCTGGTSKSFLTIKNLKVRNLSDFSGYRTDNPSATYVSEMEMKKFLYEEQVIKKYEALKDLTVSFCLGSHEGLMRLGRIIYNEKSNRGLFCPYGAYGLIVHSLGVMKPTSYKVYLIDIDRSNGEKLKIDSLKRAINRHPNVKTLILEMKTMAGAVYTEKEIQEIISLCQSKGLFLIADYTHFGMEFNKTHLFPDLIGICLSKDYHQFGVLYTGSKVYGLERARVGFLILSKKNTIYNLQEMYSKELTYSLGEVMDLPFEVMRALFDASLEKRKSHKLNESQRLRFNMNLMIAYINGADSPMIDDDLKERVRRELTPSYAKGIKGIKVVYKPVGGMHMKIDVSDLQNKYFSSIRIYNSEIFSNLFNKLYDVATLYSFEFLDPHGFTMRLSFMNKDHVHRGMRSLKNLVGSLTDKPTKNEFPEIMHLLQGGAWQKKLSFKCNR